MPKVMIHIAIPTTTARRLPFYLATEEWVARNLGEADYFFEWRVAPTVICGRHQEIDKEVNLEYCKANGIDVVRRKSGGGAVFADMNNWMFSYITPGDSFTTFGRYTSMIADMLGSLGFEATGTGRNDILIGGSKVAGNAFYHIPGRCIVHGTMLLDIDFEHMGHALTPSKGKLESKGVKSVAARVTSLHAEGLAMDVAEFGRYASSFLCDEEIILTDEQIKEIEEIERGYYDPAYLRVHGEKKPGARRRSIRIPDFGELTATVVVERDCTIGDVTFSGDFLVPEGTTERLGDALKGVPATHDAISERLRESGVCERLGNLTPEVIATLITE